MTTTTTNAQFNELVIQAMAKPLQAVADATIEAAIKAATEAAQASAPNLQTVEIEVTHISDDAAEVLSSGPVHPVTVDALKTLNSAKRDNQQVYIWGEPGSSKTTTAIKIAELLNVPFYVIACAMTKWDLLGFTLPGVTLDNGEPRIIETGFVKAWRDGGVVILDDADRSVPKALTVLNSGLANGWLDLSHLGLGTVERHPDCYIIMTGNSNLQGGDGAFATEFQDAALRDRFPFVKMDTCNDFEMSIAPNKSWCERVQAIRDYLRTQPPQYAKAVFPTMRATFRGAEMLAAGCSPAFVEESVIWKGCSDDVRNFITAGVGPCAESY